MALITPEGRTIPSTIEYPPHFTIHPEVVSPAQPSPSQPSPAQPSPTQPSPAIDWSEEIKKSMTTPEYLHPASAAYGQPSTAQPSGAPLANGSTVEQSGLYQEVYNKVMADIMSKNQNLQKEIVDLKAQNMQLALIGNLNQSPKRSAEEALADFFGYNKEKE